MYFLFSKKMTPSVIRQKNAWKRQNKAILRGVAPSPFIEKKEQNDFQGA